MAFDSQTAALVDELETASVQRLCRHSLIHNGQCTFLGTAIAPMGLDADDTFPDFHRNQFSRQHYEFLIAAIRVGGFLNVETTFEGNTSLAYTMGNPNYW